MDDIYRSQFRLPYSLYEKLKTEADKAGRSVNAELVVRLSRSFEENAQPPISPDSLPPLQDQHMDQLATEVLRRLLGRGLINDEQRYNLDSVTLPPAPPDKPKLSLPPRKPKP